MMPKGNHWMPWNNISTSLITTLVMYLSQSNYLQWKTNKLVIGGRKFGLHNGWSETNYTLYNAATTHWHISLCKSKNILAYNIDLKDWCNLLLNQLCSKKMEWCLYIKNHKKLYYPKIVSGILMADNLQSPPQDTDCNKIKFITKKN